MVAAGDDGVNGADHNHHRGHHDHGVQVGADRRYLLIALGLIPVFSAHVVVTDGCLNDGSSGRVLDHLQQCLADHFDVEHSTFQLEAARHSEHEAPTHD